MVTEKEKIRKMMQKRALMKEVCFALCIMWFIGIIGCRAWSCAVDPYPQAHASTNITIPVALWRRTTNNLNDATTRIKVLQKKLKAEREGRRDDANTCASRLLAKDIQIAQIRKTKTPQPCHCTGWKVGTGVLIGTNLICGGVLLGREVVR